MGLRERQLTGDSRKLHNEELHDLYCSSDSIRVIRSRKMRWTEHVARKGEKFYRVVVRKREEKEIRGRYKRRWDDNMQMDLALTGWECVYWIYLV